MPDPPGRAFLLLDPCVVKHVRITHRVLRASLIIAAGAIIAARGVTAADIAVSDDGSRAEQSRPRIAISPNKSMVVVWEDKRGGAPDIMLQRFDLLGKALGQNVPVNGDTGAIVHNAPAIALDAFERYSLVWLDYRNGAYPFGPNVYYQRLDSAGNPYGVNRRLTVEPPDSLRAAPDVAMALWGGGLVVWEDYRNRNWDVYAQRIAGDGSLTGVNFKVNDDQNNAQQHAPRVAVAPDGWYVVTWYDNRWGNDDVFVQRLDSAGGKLGQNIKINSDAGSAKQAFPDVAADGAGHFTVVWVDWRNGTYPNNPDIYARKYDTLLNAVYVDTRVNRDGSLRAQRDPSVAADRLGNVGIVWSDSGSTSFDIAGQMIDVDGKIRETNFRANFSTDSAQVQPDIALDGRNRYVAWTDKRDGNWDIYASITQYNNPTLVPTPSSLKFVAEKGKSWPLPQSVIIAHAGYNRLSYAVRTSAPWVSVAPDSGLTVDTVTVAVTDTSLAAGSYSGLLTLVDLTNHDSSIAIPVVFEYRAPNNDTVRIGSAQTTPGNPVSVPLTIIASDSLAGVSLPIHFDTGIVRVDSVVPGDNLPAGSVVTWSVDSVAGAVMVTATFDSLTPLPTGPHQLGGLWVTGRGEGQTQLDTIHVDSVGVSIQTAAGTVRIPVVQPGDVTVGLTTDVGDQAGTYLPSDFTLGQNYPNPFNGSTVITYDLPRPGIIVLEVFNILGQKVSTLANRYLPAGRYNAQWTGRNDHGVEMPTGVYFYRLTSGRTVLVRKLILLK